MDTQEQVYGLMAVIQDHQKATLAAIEGLAAERTALARERASLSQAATGLADMAAHVRTTVAETTREAAREAITQSVDQSLASVSDIAAKALQDALDPITARLSGAAHAAGQAEGKLTHAVASFGWKWAILAGGATAGGIVAVLLAALLTAGWERHQVEELKEERAALLDEVAQLQVQAEDWAKRGGRAKLEVCGDTSRLCVRVDKTTAYGKNRDHFVLRGY
ncbi:MAG: hypothetical protein ABJA60_12215 [Nitrosospira sp.]